MGDYQPRVVIVPESLTMREVEKAVGICMQLGLLESRAGYVIVPQGTFVKVPYQPEAERGSG
jgi:hypothetical protein